MSMIEALLKSHHPICAVLRRRIGSLESPGGPWLYASPDGRTTDPCGQPVCPVSLSVQPGSKQEPTTSDTSPPSFCALSASADLQRSLASRWQARLQGKNGSPEYVWTCKQWAIPSQPSIFALRARARTAKDGLIVEILNPSSSEHPISGSGSTGSHIVGWGTPSVQDSRHASMSPAQQVRDPNVLHNQVYLTEPPITGWRSPATSEPGVSLDRLVDSEGNPWTPGQRAYDKITGRLAQVGLTHEAQAAIPLTGWPTPQAIDASGQGREPRLKKDGNRDLNLEGSYRADLKDAAYIIGSAYPSPQTASGETTKSSETNALSADSPMPGTANAPAPPRTDMSMKSSTENSTLVGWATPGARDHKDSPGMSETGVNPDGSIRNRLDQLGRQVGLTQPKQISGWLTPSANDDAAGLPGSKMQQMLGHQAKLTDPDGLDSGQASTSSPAATAKPGVLNPHLPRWLQGYPMEWCLAAIKANQTIQANKRKKKIK